MICLAVLLVILFFVLHPFHLYLLSLDFTWIDVVWAWRGVACSVVWCGMVFCCVLLAYFVLCCIVFCIVAVCLCTWTAGYVTWLIISRCMIQMLNNVCQHWSNPYLVVTANNLDTGLLCPNVQNIRSSQHISETKFSINENLRVYVILSIIIHGLSSVVITVWFCS